MGADWVQLQMLLEMLWRAGVRWERDSDFLTVYYMWVDFYLAALVVGVGLVNVLLYAHIARSTRDRVRATRVREGRADGPHDTADNVRDILRELLGDRLACLRPDRPRA